MVKKQEKIVKNSKKAKKTFKIVIRSVITLVVAAVIFIFVIAMPVYSVIKEKRKHDQAVSERERLKMEREEKQNVVDWLKTIEGIESVAREHGMIAQGEEVIIFPPRSEIEGARSAAQSSQSMYYYILILFGFFVVISIPIFMIIFIKRRLALREKRRMQEESDEVFLRRR